MPRPKKGTQSALTVVKVDYSAVQGIFVPYRRVSTREQADSGIGLDAQKTGIDLGLAVNGWRAHSWDCVDKGRSAKNMNRAELKRAISIVQAGEASGIIVSKLDRLSRSLLDFVHLMNRANVEGWNIIALDMNLDLSSPAGKMLAGILAVFAEFERNLISQRTKDALAEKRAQGVQLGRERVVTDELLTAIVEDYATDFNYSSTARWLNTSGVETLRGGKMWYPASVEKLVKSPEGQELMKKYLEMSVSVDAA